MFVRVNRFRKSEAGAVTVDWIVLTAGLVGLVLAANLVVRGGAVALADDTATRIDEAGALVTSGGSDTTVGGDNGGGRTGSSGGSHGHH